MTTAQTPPAPTHRGRRRLIALVSIILLFMIGMPMQGQRVQAQASAPTCRIEQVPMRDGVRLTTEVYLPDTPGPYPVIVQRSPYNRLGAPINCDSATMLFFARNGYAVVNQDVRGTYRSSGTFNPMLQEASDGYDAIEWAAAQTWSTGKVGMIGGSYVGLTQWQAAMQAPPHLVAIAPHYTASDYHDHWTYVNGAFDLWFAQSWILFTFGPDTYRRQLAAQGLPPEEIDRLEAAWVAAGRRDILDSWVWQLPLNSFSALQSVAPYYGEWLDHPTYDDYWARLDLEPRYGNLSVPVLNTGGWYDIFQVGTVRNFQGMQAGGGSAAARNGSKLVLRALCHACPDDTFAGAIDFGPNNQLDLNALYLRWFDRWLKGIDNDIDREPAVQLFVMVPPDTGTTGSGFWVTGEAFPLAGTTFKRFNLRSNGKANTRLGGGVLAANHPSTGPADTFIYDPHNPVPTRGGNMCCINDLLPSGAFDQAQIELRDDVLVYTSSPLTEDLAVIGPVSLTFWATSTAPDTDFTAKLVDVHLDGFAQNVLDRIIPARYRAGSKVPPTNIVPGQAYEYTLDLGNTATIFRKGHRIRLEISSSNFPHYARNLNTGQPIASESEIVSARQWILHDPAHRSYLELPVVPSTSLHIANRPGT
ncbi:MAG TPA: CocE/NonD family hydrolase [Herpetosiphonaceae bacterium]